MVRVSLAAVFVLSSCMADSAAAQVEREDMYVETEDGLSIFVRRVVDGRAEEDRGPFLLVNGGRPGVLASWDVDVPDPSVAALLSEAGHTVYLMDARGFGRSDFTAEMADGAEDGPVAVRSHEVVRDIAAVVREIRRRHADDDYLAALGWATGSQWLGHYASLYPDAFSHLIYYQGAYGGQPGGWPFQDIAREDDAALLDRARFPAFRCSTAEQVVGRLADEIDDEAFLDRYVELAMEGDERAAEREPACFRFPSGPLADTLQLVNGRPLFDAGAIESHVLILRSEHDFWSRAEDIAALQDHLDRAATVRIVELEGASHYVHLLPDERGTFVEAVLTFTAGKGPSSTGEPRSRNGAHTSLPTACSKAVSPCPRLATT